MHYKESSNRFLGQWLYDCMIRYFDVGGGGSGLLFDNIHKKLCLETKRSYGQILGKFCSAPWQQVFQR